MPHEQASGGWEEKRSGESHFDTAIFIENYLSAIKILSEKTEGWASTSEAIMECAYAGLSSLPSTAPYSYRYALKMMTVGAVLAIKQDLKLRSEHDVLKKLQVWIGSSNIPGKILFLKAIGEAGHENADVAWSRLVDALPGTGQRPDYNSPFSIPALGFAAGLSINDPELHEACLGQLTEALERINLVSELAAISSLLTQD